MPSSPPALSAAILLLAAASAPVHAGGPFDYELKQVVPDVYVAYRPDVFRQPVDGNVVFIVNAEDVVVVDAGGTPASARSVLGLLRSVTEKPVSTLVNTHWHGDHHLGNSVWREAFPGLEIVAHTKTLAAMTPQNIGLDTFPEQLTKMLGDLRRGLETGKDPEGNPLPDDRRARWQQMIPDLEVALEQAKKARVVLPTLTFEEKLVLRRGEREIEIRYLGRGNTESDAIVWLPRERVVASGDLVVHPQPYGFGSYPKEWIETLGRLADLDYRFLIPGHGEVQQDTTYIRNLQALIERVRTRVAAAVKEGATLERVQSTLDVGDLEPVFTAGDARRKVLLKAWFLDPFAISAYKEAKGEPIVQGQRG